MITRYATLAHCNSIDRLHPNRSICATAVSMSSSPLPDSPVSEWLCLGVDGSGKTCLVRSIIAFAAATSAGGRSDAAEVDLATQPTNGVEREIIQITNGPRIAIKEIGGSLRSTWAGYYGPAVSGAIFVIDASEPAHLAAAVYELAAIITHAQMAHCNFIVVLHKSDGSGALTRADLHSSIRLDELLAEADATRLKDKQPTNNSSNANAAPIAPAKYPIGVVETSSVRGTGIADLLDKLRVMS